MSQSVLVLPLTFNHKNHWLHVLNQIKHSVTFSKSQTMEGKMVRSFGIVRAETECLHVYFPFNLSTTKKSAARNNCIKQDLLFCLDLIHFPAGSAIWGLGNCVDVDRHCSVPNSTTLSVCVWWANPDQYMLVALLCLVWSQTVGPKELITTSWPQNSWSHIPRRRRTLELWYLLPP